MDRMPCPPQILSLQSPYPTLATPHLLQEPLFEFSAEGSSSESFTKQLSAGQSMPAFDSHLTTTSSLNPFSFFLFFFFWCVDLFSLRWGDVNVRQQQRGEIKGQERCWQSHGKGWFARSEEMLDVKA